VTELALPVGIDFASQGEVREVVEWAERAARAGLHCVWLNDSLLELNAATYALAIASQMQNTRVAMGASRTCIRHPALTAMTISPLYETAPGRMILGMGMALPLRLRQMGFPYMPDEAIEIPRPFSVTASTMPIFAAAGLRRLSGLLPAMGLALGAY
jgi:alkanesulfonate monooxygenase SsuD/methylene tetrahydromethanopterin reductase-like flavin-dependent oxidoreductase (luciferase family)